MTLSICVHSQVLSPDEMTRIAGVEPSDSYCLGDRKGLHQEEKYISNYWARRIKVNGAQEERDETDWFSDGLIRLLSPTPVDFVNELKAQDPEVSAILWIGLFDIQDQGALNIRSDVSRMLGERDLELVFDMYIDHKSER